MRLRSLARAGFALFVVVSMACAPEAPTGEDAGTGKDAGPHTGNDAGFAEELPPPTITVFEATPDAVRFGGATSVRWEANDSDECTVSFRGVSVTDDDEGSLPIEDIEDDLVVALSCQSGNKRANATLTVRVLPTITSFTATPTAVNAGDTVTLSWETTHAEGCELSFGDETYTLAPNEREAGSHDVVPSARGEATLACTDDEGGRDEATVSLAVARVLSFEATPSAAVLGQEVTLTWTHEDTSGPCAVDGVVDLAPTDTVATVTLEEPGEQTFTLRCEGIPPSTEVTATVTVPVLIHSFSAAPAVVDYGGATSLSFGVSNAVTSCDVNGVAAPLGAPFATEPLRASTPFVLRCEDDEGRTAVTEPLVIGARPHVVDFYPTLGPSDAVLLVWQTENALDCTVSHVGGDVLGAGASGSVGAPAGLTERADFELSCVSDAGDDEAVLTTTSAWFGTLRIEENDSVAPYLGLRLVLGDVTIVDHAQAAEVVATLDEVSGSLDLTGSYLGATALSSLRALGGSLNLSGTTTDGVIRADRLEHVEGNLVVFDDATLQGLDAPALREVGGSLQVAYVPALGSLSVPLLTSVSALHVQSAPLLETLALPALVELSSLNVSENAALPCWRATDLYCQVEDTLESFTISNNLDGCSIAEPPDCP